MAQLAIDINSYKRISSTFLKGSGLQFESIKAQRDFKDKLKIFLKNSYFIFCLMNILVHYIFTCKKMLSKSEGNVKLLFYFFCTAESTGTALVRIVFSFVIKSDIGRIERLTGRSYTKIEADYYQLNGVISTYKRIMRFYFSSIVLTLTFFILDPILTLILTGQRTFGNMSPFDDSMATAVIFPFAMLWTCYEFSCLICIMVAVETILYNALMTTILEFKILKKDFEDLKKVESSKLSDEVRKLIKRHDSLYDVVNNLESAYSFPLFCNFYSTALLICFTAFQASTSNEAGELIGMGYFCISSLFQIFVQSYLGDLLKTVSVDVVHGIFESGWEEMSDMRVRRELPFIIKRARKPAKLTCMNIADVSLVQFANVVSVSYSFFTLCRRIYLAN